MDPTGRLQPAATPEGQAERLVTAAPTSPATALLAHLCGSLGYLFAARATAVEEQLLLSSDNFVSRFLVVAGKITPEPERLTITLPMVRVALCLRKSALDRDPGWVQWLGRTVRIEFEPR